MVFQDPMTSLDPTMKIGRQIEEVITLHRKVKRRDARKRMLELLKLVGIEDPERRSRQYPHEFSGGQRQRIVIAIVLACDPKVLIADEPTTALDVTMQAQIIDLLKSLQNKINTSIIFITHDLGVVANVADRVAVMYAGKIIEIGRSAEIFYDPRHPYTWGLLNSMPTLDTKYLLIIYHSRRTSELTKPPQ
jgi:oligopeptide transport system ATP-binding protein